MPSGNDTQTAHAVFDNLYAHYLAAIPIDRTEILWLGPIYIAIYGLSLIIFFLLLSKYLRQSGTHKGQLLELTSFAGHLNERVGELALFSYLVWLFVVAWAAYFAIRHILFGLIY